MWPLVTRAQQSGHMRRVGVLMPAAAEETEAKARIAAFVSGLRELGWIEGTNVQIVYRWSGGNTADTRKYASELASLALDVILAIGTAGTVAQSNTNRTYRICNCCRPSRFWDCEESFASWRKCHRLYDV